MKKNMFKIIAAILSAALLYVFFQVLIIYTEPMKNFSIDLSLSPRTEGVFELNFDEKGWEVYTREGKIIKDLIPDGTGSYTGIEAGQTFYYSRVLKEEVDNPILQLEQIGQKSISVFLDDTLIYTDHPELDNRIGYLTLPTNDTYNANTLILSLPRDYLGKTLTIAQSTPPISDAYQILAMPIYVTFCCGYSYESNIIAESFRVAIGATAAFIIGTLLLLAFIHKPNIGLLCICLAIFLWMCLDLKNTSFFTSYFGEELYTNIETGIRLLINGLLLIYLCTRTGKDMKIKWILPLVYLISLFGFIYIYITDPVTIRPFYVLLKADLQIWIFMISLMIIFVLGLLFWRKENYFFQLFVPLFLIANIGYWSYHLSTDNLAAAHILANLKSGSIWYISHRLIPITMIITIIAAFYEFFRNELIQRTEKHLLLERQEMALESYNNLKNQHQEIMMLRHDMNRHFHLLQQMDKTEQMKTYLEELIGQNEKIRPVIVSGNEIFDIILNGKISVAARAGIKTEIEKMEVPKNLPLTDSDLCSLLTNIMDNAIAAAQASHMEHPYLHLNIHEKNNFLSILCENTANRSQLKENNPKNHLKKHGLGLKIIASITERYEGILDTEYGKSYYKLQIAIPLS